MAGPGKWQESSKNRALLLSAVLFALLVAVPSLSYPFGRDQAMFAYIGYAWTQGQLPIRDAFDVKPPAIYIVYYLLELFNHGTIGPRVVDAIATATISASVFTLGVRLGSRHVGIAAAFLYPIYYYFFFDFWHTAQSEHLSTACLAVALALLATSDGRRWRTIVAALFVVLMISFKPTNVVMILPALPLLKGKKIFWITMPVIGLVLGAALCIYYELNGSLSSLSELLTAQSNYARRGAPVSFDLQSTFRTQAFIWMPLFVAVIAGTGGVWIRTRLSDVALLWCTGAFATILIQGRFFSYHFVSMAMPALMIGCISYSNLLTCRFPITRSGAVVSLGLIGFCFRCVPNNYIMPSLMLHSGQMTRSDYLKRFDGLLGFSSFSNEVATEYIGATTTPHQTLSVLAFEPYLYYGSKRLSASRHLSLAPLYGELQIPVEVRERWIAELRRDCEENPPNVLVTIGDIPSELGQHWQATGDHVADYCGSSYILVKTQGLYRIFVRV